jgi:hypothetical protein
MRTTTITRQGALALLVGSVALAGCGGSSYGGGSKSSSKSSAAGGAYGSSGSTSNAKPAAAGATVKLNADGGGGLYFQQRKLSAKAGAVTLAMTDPSSSGLAHGIAINGSGVDKDGPVVQPGNTSTVTVGLKPGTKRYGPGPCRSRSRSTRTRCASSR